MVSSVLSGRDFQRMRDVEVTGARRPEHQTVSEEDVPTFADKKRVGPIPGVALCDYTLRAVFSS